MKCVIVGCGVMGSAFARALAKKNQVILSGRQTEKLEQKGKELNLPVETPQKALAGADVIILAIKPKDLAASSLELSPYLGKGQLLISILAGTSSDTLRSVFTQAEVVRTMPNLAVICGTGIIGVVDSVSEDRRRFIHTLFDDLGFVYFLPENKMDAFTAVCGSSPAFILLVLEAMMEGAVSLGFSFADAKELVMRAFDSSLALLRFSHKHPAELKMDIASPGGTTIAGLGAMEEMGIRAALIHTLRACYERSKEMSRQSPL